MTLTATKPKVEALVFTDVIIKMRLGTTADFRKEISFIGPNNEILSKAVPNYGQSYWVRSKATGKFDNRNYQISPDTDWEEIKFWIRNNMIYVAASDFELKNAES